MLYLLLFIGLFSIAWVIATLRIMLQTSNWSWYHHAHLAFDIAIFGTIAIYCAQRVMP